MSANDAKALFFDLETTGLDPKSTVILEIGARAVDAQLNTLATFHRVIGYDPIPTMNDWCLKTHGDSGLLKEVSGSEAIALRGAEMGLCYFADRWFPNGKIILAGNTIGFDRAYIREFLPNFEKKLHYRMLDVTAVYLAKSLFANGKEIKHEGGHRSLVDVDSSIKFLKELLKND